MARLNLAHGLLKRNCLLGARLRDIKRAYIVKFFKFTDDALPLCKG